MGVISNLFGFGKTLPTPNEELFAKFDRSYLQNASPAQLEQNRQSLHDLFASKNWDNLSLDDKKAAVQALENDFAFQQGRPAKTVEVTHLDDGCYGGWSAGADKIYLNENLVENGSLYTDEYATAMVDANIQIFDTIAHEGYHAYQTYALNNPDVHEDKEQLREWALNEGRYYGKGAEYNIQPQERDAWQYGHDKTVEAFYGIENRVGSELGMPEYNAMCQTNSYSVKLAEAQSREPDVLEHMEQEMIAACEAKGINYDFSGESQNQTFVAKAEEGSLEQETPPELVNSPPEQENAQKMSIDELLAPQEEKTEEKVISLDEIAAEASQAEAPAQESTQKMTIDQLLAPDPSMAEKSASMDDIAPVHEQDSSETVEQSQSYSL